MEIKTNRCNSTATFDIPSGEMVEILDVFVLALEHEGYNAVSIRQALVEKAEAMCEEYNIHEND